MTATATRALNEPVDVPGAAPRTAFFNGRLLSAEDLQREQALRSQGERRLAQLAGCGVAEGLDVRADAGSTSVQVDAGTGVTPSGEVIATGALSISLTSAAGGSTASGGFANCAGALTDLRAPGAGLYLLVLSPAWRPSGRAATLLGEVGACNRDVELAAVRPRLVAITSPDTPAGADTLRNVLARALLAPEPPNRAAQVGWLPKARFTGALGSDDLPLAVLKLNAQAAVEWVDVQAAQRRLAPPPGGAGDGLWDRSSVFEMEAFARQFAAHVRALLHDAPAEPWPRIEAAVAYWPPVAVLDAAGQPALEEALKSGAWQVVGRAAFVRAMEDGLRDRPVARGAERVTVLQWRGTTRYLLRFADRNDPDPPGDTGPLPRGAGEFSSKRLASAAGKALRSKTATETERHLAGSVLTQARDRKRKG